MVSASLVLFAGVTSASGARSDGDSDPKNPGQFREAALDITGDAALSTERDILQDLLSPLAEFDGGSSWDPVTQTMTIRMTSEEAIQSADSIVEKSLASFSVAFERVEYSARELNALSEALLTQQADWAGATGIGGGFDPAENRVVLQVDPLYENATKLIKAIEGLQDPRVVLQTIEPIEGWAPESRTDDFSPWTAGAAINSSTGGCTLGWAWKHWSSGQVVGSTARHCATLTWTNNGDYV